MSGVRGIDLAVFMVCFGLAFMVLGGMGWFAWVGIHPETGGFEQEANETGHDMFDHDEEVPTSGGGLLDAIGTVTGMMDGLQLLFNITVGARWFLMALGVPGPLATAYWLVVNISVSITALLAIRGLTAN